MATVKALHFEESQALAESSGAVLVALPINQDQAALVLELELEKSDTYEQCGSNTLTKSKTSWSISLGRSLSPGMM
jgi:hypothetical protein